MCFLIWHILAMTIIVVNIYSFADDQNRYSEPEIDKYLPTTKNIKMSKLYHFSEKKRPVRYKAYLAEKIGQILSRVEMYLK